MMTILTGSVLLLLATLLVADRREQVRSELSELPERESIHPFRRARGGLADISCISDSRWRWSVLSSNSP